MFRTDFSKPTRKSMLGKHGQRNIVPGSKSRPTPKKEDTLIVSDYLFSATRPRFQLGFSSSRPISQLGLSASRPKSQLGRRVQNEDNSSVYKQKEGNSENSSTVKKNPVYYHNFQHNAKKSLFNSSHKENKRSVNVQPNIKKCLFSKENEDPYLSKWNYETSAADVTGITDLPLFSASQPKSLMLERARKRTQELKHNDDYTGTLKKRLTPQKTPKISHKELSCNGRSGVTPHRFLSYNPFLKSPTPPPPLYDSYLRQKLRNVNHPEEKLLLTSTSSRRSPFSVNKSPKRMETNSARNKFNHKSCENITTTTKSPTVINSTYIVKKFDYPSLQNLVSINKTPKTVYTNSAHKKFDHTSCENLSHNNLSTNRTQNNLVCSLSWENLSTIQTLKKGNDLVGCNIETFVDDKTDFKRNLQILKQKSSNLKEFGCPANSTAIEESEDTDDSFILNEMQSMIEDVTEMVKKKANQLSVVTEEGSITTSIEQSMNDKCEADLTLCVDVMKQYCEQQNGIKDNVNDSDNVDDPSQGSVYNINLIQINIEQMANENIELIGSFQREILNEYSIKLTERLNEVIKEQILIRNKIIQNELENVLRSNLCIFKNNIKKQYEECIKLLDPLKSSIDFETSNIQSTSTNKMFSYMQTEAERMLEENEKLVESLQKDVVQDFQNQMTLVVNKNIYAQIDAVSNVMKGDLENIVLEKWNAVAQQMEFKKKQCLSYLEFMKNELNKEKVERSQEFKEKVDHFQSDLNSFSNLNGELVNDYKKQIFFDFQNKVSMVSKKIIEQQVKDILNTFQTTNQEKLNLFIPKLNSQSDKWLSFKSDITKSIESSNQNYSGNSKVDDICTGITSIQLPDEFKSPIKVESTKKIYSELRSQFKFCLKTPEVSSGRLRSISHNQSCVLTPRSMSTIINDQVNQIFNS